MCLGQGGTRFDLWHYQAKTCEHLWCHTNQRQSGSELFEFYSEYRDFPNLSSSIFADALKHVLRLKF